MRTPEQIEVMVPPADRSAQRFPRLRETQLEIVKRFASEPAHTFAPREPMFQVGDRGVPAWFILKGSAELFGRDGLDQETAVRTAESGQFTGELHQLTGGPALVGPLPDPMVAPPFLWMPFGCAPSSWDRPNSAN